jgi:hypothetical protein
LRSLARLKQRLFFTVSRTIARFAFMRNIIDGNNNEVRFNHGSGARH